jgi:hypothetical protein
MKERIVTALLLVTLTTMFTATHVTPLAAKQPKDNSVSLPFSAPGTVNGIPAVVTGTFNVTRFEATDGRLLAVGTIVATVPDGAGVRSIITPAAIPVDTTASGTPNAVSQAAISAQAVCGILHLELGPLDLDLLGLVVHLDRVVLDISAESGPGNLLGNLLCSVAGLLDGGLIGGLLDQIAALLNQILAAL